MNLVLQRRYTEKKKSAVKQKEVGTHRKGGDKDLCIYKQRDTNSTKMRGKSVG